MKMVLGIALALALSVPAVAAPRVDDPSALVRKVYADIAVDHRGDPLWWGYLTGPARTLLLRANKLGQQTGSAIIDFDYLCQCQDPISMRISSLSVTKSSPTHATAHVRFGYPGKEQTALRLDLVNEGGWKIANMTDSKGKSFTGLVQLLLKQNGDK